MKKKWTIAVVVLVVLFVILVNYLFFTNNFFSYYYLSESIESPMAYEDMGTNSIAHFSIPYDSNNVFDFSDVRRNIENQDFDYKTYRALSDILQNIYYIQVQGISYSPKFNYSSCEDSENKIKEVELGCIFIRSLIEKDEKFCKYLPLKVKVPHLYKGGKYSSTYKSVWFEARDACKAYHFVLEKSSDWDECIEFSKSLPSSYDTRYYGYVNNYPNVFQEYCSIFHNHPESCVSLGYPTSAGCLNMIVYLWANEEACELIADDQKDSCYRGLAYKTNNESYCYQIVQEADRDRCSTELNVSLEN